MTTDTPATGALPVVVDSEADGPAIVGDFDQYKVDPAQAVLDQLVRDAVNVPILDQGLYTMGCRVSALATLIPDGLRKSVFVYDPATSLVDIEITAVDGAAADAISKALPWSGQVFTRSEPSETLTGRYRIWQGLLWDTVRVRVAGLETPGGDES